MGFLINSKLYIDKNPREVYAQHNNITPNTKCTHHRPRDPL